MEVYVETYSKAKVLIKVGTRNKIGLINACFVRFSAFLWFKHR